MKTQRLVARRYTIELTLYMAIYAILLFGSIWIAQHVGPTNRVTLAALVLIPMLPVIGVCAAVIRYLRSCDELERQIQLTAISISVMVTAFASLSYGFLEGVGFPKLSMFYVWPLMAIVWVASKLVYQSRLQ